MDDRRSGKEEREERGEGERRVGVKEDRESRVRMTDRVGKEEREARGKGERRAGRQGE